MDYYGFRSSTNKKDELINETLGFIHLGEYHQALENCLRLMLLDENERTTRECELKHAEATRLREEDEKAKKHKKEHKNFHQIAKQCGNSVITEIIEYKMSSGFGLHTTVVLTKEELEK